MKKYLLGSLAVFITVAVLDFVIHGMILKGTYEATASMWRPMAEMNMGLMYLVTALVSLAFTAIYAYHVKGASPSAGAKFGLLYGLATGISMGFGSYLYMPIPYSLAWGWFLGCVVEGVVAGAVAGWVVKPSA